MRSVLLFYDSAAGGVSVPVIIIAAVAVIAVIAVIVLKKK